MIKTNRILLTAINSIDQVTDAIGVPAADLHRQLITNYQAIYGSAGRRQANDYADMVSEDLDYLLHTLLEDQSCNAATSDSAVPFTAAVTALAEHAHLGNRHAHAVVTAFGRRYLELILAGGSHAAERYALQVATSRNARLGRLAPAAPAYGWH